MSEEEIKFLRDQVQRLNLMLAKYQANDSLGIKVDDDMPEVPWLTEQSFLAPLLQEYDASIDKLAGELDTQREYIRDYKSQVERLISENNRLQRDLKAHVTGEIERLTSSGGGRHEEVDSVQENLHLQLTEAMKEKEASFELWQSALREVDRLEAEVNQLRSSPQYRMLEDQAAQLKNQYNTAVTALTSEINSLKEANRRLKADLTTSTKRLGEFEMEGSSVEGRMESQRRALNDVTAQRDSAVLRADQMERQCADLKNQLSFSQKEASHENREKGDWDRRLTELQTKCSQYEEQSYQAVQQVKESVQMAENALMEKEQAIVRERQKEEECERLQTAINHLLDEAGSRTREEVEVVRQQANQNLNRVIEELNLAETEKSEKAAEIERLIREKRGVETEVERLHNADRVRQLAESTAAEEANRRALRAERERDELRLAGDTARVAAQRDQLAFRNERAQLRAEIEQLRERLQNLNQTSERAQSEAQRYAAIAEEAETKLVQARKEAERSERKANQQASLLEQAARLKEQEYQSRLQSGADTQRDAMQEMRQMLALQQKVSARWKDECHGIAAKMEETIGHLRGEVDRQKKRNEELSIQLMEVKNKLADNDTQICDYKKHVKRLEERLKRTERRTVVASQQASKFIDRDQKWIKFKEDQQTAIRDTLTKRHTTSTGDIKKDSREKEDLDEKM